MPTPDFILNMREKIGHDEMWLPGVTAVVIRDVPKDAPIWAVPEVLLVKRADDGQWTPVTGIVDPREEPHVAAVREVLEETGLHAQVEALLGVGAVGPVEYPNGDMTSYMDTAMRLSIVRPDATGEAGSGDDSSHDAQRAYDEPIIGDDESVDVGWFSVAQMPPMQPRFRLIIADAVAQMKHPSGFKPRMGYRKRNGDPLRGE